MQQTFFPQPPNAPGRPAPASMHRAHPSVVQLAAAGILPPPGMLAGPGVQGGMMPMTPLGQNGFPPQMMPIPFQPFVPKSRRTQSVSTGGPPKAVLGGPQRKVSPMPGAATNAVGGGGNAAVAVAPAPAGAGVAGTSTTPGAPAATPATASSSTAAPPVRAKKVIINLPKETVKDAESGEETRPTWARTPLPVASSSTAPDVVYPELTTSEAFPPDSWRHHLPPTVDVFLPGKVRVLLHSYLIQLLCI